MLEAGGTHSRSVSPVLWDSMTQRSNWFVDSFVRGADIAFADCGLFFCTAWSIRDGTSILVLLLTGSYGVESVVEVVDAVVVLVVDLYECGEQSIPRRVPAISS